MAGRIQRALAGAVILVALMANMAGAEATCTKIGEFDSGFDGWNLADGGEFPGAKGKFSHDSKDGFDGKGCVTLAGDFSGGGAYVAMTKYFSEPLMVKKVSFQVKSSQVRSLALRFIDSSGQTHQHTVILEDVPGWQPVSISEFGGGKSRSMFYGGAKDGKWHDGMKGMAILVNKGSFNDKEFKEGVILVDKVELTLDGDSQALARPHGRPCVKFSVKPIQDGAALVSWKEFAAKAGNVKKWRIYKSAKAFADIKDAGVELVKEFNAGETSAPVFPYEPGSTWFFAVTSISDDGELCAVESAPCVFRTPFQCDNFGDMLAINHFWNGDGYGGGGANVKMDHATAWNEVALDLLAKTPVKTIRWWRCDSEIAQKYLSRGIGVMTYDWIEAANAVGMYSFSLGNEPDLSHFSGAPEKYVEMLKRLYAKAKKASKWNTYAAPTSCVMKSSIEWLDKFYASGGKDYFDVLDLHTYPAGEPPAGYPKNSPEKLIDDFAKVRKVTDKYGDSQKPIISSEFGCPDCYGHYEPLQKAQFLVRGLILHYVLGFKRVFVYSFWDAGEDPFYTEHHFGLLDYNFQKKPAFFAFCALGQILGDCVLEGSLEGCGRPSFGYHFRSKGGGYVDVVWDGSGENVGDFATEARQVKVSDIFGKSRIIVVEKDVPFSLPYGASPVYISSESPVKMLSSRRVEKAIEADESLVASLVSSCVVVADGSKSADIDVILRNGYKKAVACKVSVKGEGGAELGVKALRVEPLSELKEKVKFDIVAKDGVALVPLEAFVTYKTDVSSYSDSLKFYVRQLADAPSTPVCKQRMFPGAAKPLYVLANKSLELSFDPSQGGRMLDFIDKNTLTNQVHIDYDKIASLKSFVYEYFWFDVGGLKNEAWDAAAEDGKRLRLHAFSKKSELDVTMLWSLEGESASARLDVSVVNKSGKQSKGEFRMHPEYNLAGFGRHLTDVMSFPGKDGVVKLPFWTNLGEKPSPALTENWWRIETADGLAMKQTWPDGWNAPRIWFGNNFYNLEMSCKFDLAPDAAWNGWLTWTLSGGSAPQGSSVPEPKQGKSFWDFFRHF